MKKHLLLLTFLLLFALSAIAQEEVTLKGRVISESDGEALIGVSVIQKETTNGTITDGNGNFVIKVKNDAIIVVSYVGYESQTISVKGKKELTISLKENQKILDEIVVTALGIKRSEKALGYSVQKVSGEDIQKVLGTDLVTSLTGKVAGLLVKNPSDFAVNPELTIRGEKPLMVIDGVPYKNKTLSDIAGEDIESLQVLKGATASALYGFQGSNGAIMITTKNGSANENGMTVDITSNTMFTAGFLAIPEKQSVYGRGSNNTYDKNSSSSWGPKMEGQMLEQWDPFEMKYRTYEYLPIGKDNYKNFLEQGYVTNNNVNVAYKKDAASIRGSINWTENKGQYPNQKLDKYSYTLGGDFSVNKLKFSSNVAYSKRHSPNMGTNGYTSYDPMYALLIWSAADYNLLDYKNNYWLINEQTPKGRVQNFTYRKDQNNPYYDAYEKTNEVSRDIFNADLTLSYNVAHWLKATVRSGLDFYIDEGIQRIAWGSYVSMGNTSTPASEGTWNGTNNGGYTIGQAQGFSMNNDFMLTGDKAFGKFNVEYVAGAAISYNKDKKIFGATQGGITVPGFYSLAASVNAAEIKQDVKGLQTNSLYARAGLSWDRLVYVDLTARNDWTSTQIFTPNKSYFYPSVATSFVISELMPQTKDWLDLLKIRGSWTVSKKPAGIYATNSTFNVYPATWGTMNGAAAPSSLYDSNIRPETTTTFEVGMQGMMFKNRLMADVSYYDRRVSDILRQDNNKAPISEASGYTHMTINTNEIISRRGWEVTVSGTPIKTNDWQLDLAVNWSKFADYYVQLDDVYTKDAPWIKKGRRTDAFVSKAFQYDPSGNLILSNGRPLPSSYDSNFGWTNPDWLWGANATVRYKNFSLFMSFDGVVGGLTNTRTESYMWQSGVHPNSATDERLKPYIGKGVKIVSGTATYDKYGNITNDTRVFAPNDVAVSYQQYMSDLHNSSAWGGAGTEVDTYSKTFFKFRELSLTYDIPKTFLSKYKIKGASVSFVGQNVILWAKDFKYSDPDAGKEDFSDPAVRYLGGNIKLTF
ncbi:hypothetical protein A9168_13865 [Macellibacteroides sp. HH-ZS]|nr:hypothetical protein A9168_13865 [Macellibacteroides sp. HH-ZS]